MADAAALKAAQEAAEAAARDGRVPPTGDATPGSADTAPAKTPAPTPAMPAGDVTPDKGSATGRGAEPGGTGATRAMDDAHVGVMFERFHKLTFDQMTQMQDMVRAQMQASTENTRTMVAALKPKTDTPHARINGLGRKFNGDRDALSMWVFAVSEDFQVLGRVTDADRVAYAVTLLEGAALHWFYAKCKLDQRPATWVAFLAGLRTQFASQEDQVRLRQDLFELRQTGTLGAYIQRFQEKYFLIEGLDSTTTMFAFQRGMTATLLAETLRRHPKDLEETFRYAREADEALARARPPAPPAPVTTRRPWTPAPSAPSTPGPTSTTTAPRIDVHAITTEPLRTKMTPEVKAALMKSGSCFKCRQPGHMIVDCPERRELKPATAAHVEMTASAQPVPNGTR